MENLSQGYTLHSNVIRNILEAEIVYLQKIKTTCNLFFFNYFTPPLNQSTTYDNQHVHL